MNNRPDERQFARFRDAIAALPPGQLTRGHLLNGTFVLASGTGFAVYYAPFDHVNARARVILVGLTPGWQQTRLAFETARDRLRAGESDERVLWAVKQQASFAGMRERLARWLDGIDVDRALGVASTAELFGRRAELLQTTSAVRYPVFCSGGKNWSGANPPITEPALADLVRGVLGPELRSLPHALVVPLGVAVQRGLRDLVDCGELEPDRCLFGFPHPSGANARGPRRYADARPRLNALVARWAGLPASHGEAGQSQRRPAAITDTRPVSTAELPGRARQRQLVGEREGQASTPERTIVIALTRGNLNNQHVYLRSHLDFFPADSVGGPSRHDGEGRHLTVHFDGLPKPVETDIAGGNKLFFRARRPWGDFFRLHQLRAGDRVVIERLAAYEYRVSGVRAPRRPAL